MKILYSIFFLSFCIAGYSQSEIELPLEDQYDVVTNEWLAKSAYLKTYSGVNEYCQNPAFRKSVDRLLNEIHGFDSLIVARLEDPTAYFSWNSKEEKKTMNDVLQLEEDYSMHGFVDQMRKSCLFRNEIEANADNLKRGMGVESYDGKILVLETEISKYLKKIDKLVLRVDEHLHVLHLDQ
ncbi:hypothetical protein [Ekhidna sp.]